MLTITLLATAGAAAWAGSLAGSSLPRAFAESLARAPKDFAALQWERTWLMAALIGPTAIGLGIAFPLALQMAGSRAGETTRRLGLIYALNTLCAVVGALATGFLAIPWLGLQRTLFIGTGALIASSVLLMMFGGLST